MATTFQGFNGLLVAGGIQDGAPRLNGALASAAATLALDDNGAGTLTGVILGGDTFTISGETGSPTHTVTAGATFTIASASCTSITFTPAIATGGVADNATITFTSNSVAQVTRWDMAVRQPMLDRTTLGDKWRRFKGGLASWTGTAEALLDYADPNQAKLIDRLVTATPASTPSGMVLRLTTSKQWYGYAYLSRGRVMVQKDALVRIAFDFTGDGTTLPNFT